MMRAPTRRKLRWYNKKVVDENTLALEIIKNYCLDRLDCWPVTVFSVTVFLLQILVTGILLYLTSQLYSEGMRSKKFYKEGGIHIISAAVLGVLLGIVWSVISKHHVCKVLVLSGSLMTTFTALPLAGFRGLVAGTFGGFFTGLAFGTDISNTRAGLIWGGLAGLVSGGTLGTIPIFWRLDSVKRYLGDGPYSPIHSEHSSPLSSFSSDFNEDL